MPRVILHTRQSLDESRNAGQCPQIRAEPMHPRALAQGRFDAGHLFAHQARLPPGPAGGAQRRAPTLAPRAIPTHDALAAHAQAPGDSALRLATRGKQLCGLATTDFQAMKIPSGRTMRGHAFHRTTEGSTDVTVLCETQ